MNAHQRKKLRRQRERLRRTTGLRFSYEDHNTYRKFFDVVRKLLGMKAEAYTFWITNYKLPGTAFDIEMAGALRKLQTDMEYSTYWSTPIV